MPNTNSPKRKSRTKAAEPGELEKGFYSPTFNRRELMDLGGTSNESLVDEIAMLRVSIRRLLEYSNTLEPGLEAIITITRTLGSSASHVSKLLQAQGKLKSGEAELIAAEVSRALSDVADEFNL